MRPLLGEALWMPLGAAFWAVALSGCIAPAATKVEGSSTTDSGSTTSESGSTTSESGSTTTTASGIGGSGPWTYIGSGKATDTADKLVVTPSANPEEDDLLIGACAFEVPAVVKGSTPVMTLVIGTASNHYSTAAFWGPYKAGDPTSVTFSWTDVVPSDCVLHVYRGGHAKPPAVKLAEGTPVTCGPVDVGPPPGLAFVFATTIGAFTSGLPQPFTLREAVTFDLSGDYLTAGPDNTSFSLTTTAGSIETKCLMLGFDL